MRLAAGVLVILLFPVIVIAAAPTHRGLLYGSALIAFAVLGIALAIGTTLAKPRLSSERRMDEDAIDRANALAVLFTATAIGVLALLLGTVAPSSLLLLCGLAVLWELVWLPAALRQVAVTTSVQISRDPATVFAFISDMRNGPRYASEVESVEKITPGDIGRGTRFRSRVRLPNGVFEGIEEIVDYEWAHRLSESLTSGRRPSLGVMTFEPVPGGTLLSYTYRSSVSYAAALMGLGLKRPMLVDEMRKRRQAIWEQLKRVLESPATA